MGLLREWVHRLVGTFRRGRSDADLQEELESHLETAAEGARRDGASIDDANRAVAISHGAVAQAIEAQRDQRGFNWVSQFYQDVRYGARSLRRARGFTATIVVTLALALGVNLTIFTFINALALKNLPVREPDQLVEFSWNERTRVSYATYLAIRDENTVFSGVTAWLTGPARMHQVAETWLPLDATFEMTGVGMPAHAVGVHYVADNYFTVLGGTPVLGRGFRPEDNRAPGTPAIIVLHHRFWEIHFQRDMSIVGKSLTLDGKLYTIVGVAAPGFDGHLPAPPIGWSPFMAVTREGDLAKDNWEMVGRLKAGVAFSQAQADANVIFQRRSQATGPQATRDVPLRQGMKYLRAPRQTPWIAYLPFALAFAMVLAVACANVTNLLLARGLARQREIGVRLSLGASRGRIVRQLLTENLLICTLATGLGFMLAQWTLRAVLPSLPNWVSPQLTRQFQFLSFSLDYRLFGFMAALFGFAVLVSGLAPALYGSRTDPVSVTRKLGSFLGGSIRHSRLRNGLIVAQTALCMTTLSGAGIALHAMARARTIGPGLDPTHVYAVGFATERPDTLAQVIATRAMFDRFLELPGVAAGTFVWGAPLLESRVTSVQPKGAETGPAPMTVRSSLVAVPFFHTFGIALKQGRSFTKEEVEEEAALVVVSESTASRFWPNENPLGKALAVSETARNSDSRMRDRRVIGVAADVGADTGVENALSIYLPLPAATAGSAYVRLRDESPAAIARISQAAEAAGITVGIGWPVSQRLKERSIPIVVLGWGSGILGALALAMASVGLAGVTAFTVNQRTHEIGVRLALGATRVAIIRLLVAQSMKLVAIGTMIGWAGITLLSPVFLDDLSRRFGDSRSTVFGVVALILASTALLACWLPARRAARVHPLTALRND